MKSIDMLQCTDCKRTLTEFLSKTEVTPEVEEILGQFAVFMELRRLHKKPRDTITFNPPPVGISIPERVPQWGGRGEIVC